jgi:hypothetical protein
MAGPSLAAGPRTLKSWCRLHQVEVRNASNFKLSKPEFELEFCGSRSVLRSASGFLPNTDIGVWYADVGILRYSWLTPISVLISMIPDIGIHRYRCLPDVGYTRYRVYISKLGSNYWLLLVLPPYYWQLLAIIAIIGYYWLLFFCKKVFIIATSSNINIAIIVTLESAVSCA